MAISVDDMQKRVRSELSTGSRLAHTAVGVAGLGMTALALSLLATEPVLPARTRAAFVVIALGGLAWAAFASWVLTRRRVLLAGHHVAAWASRPRSRQSFSLARSSSGTGRACSRSGSTARCWCSRLPG